MSFWLLALPTSSQVPYELLALVLFCILISSSTTPIARIIKIIK